MAGIAAVASVGYEDVTRKMLDRIAHRGTDGRKVLETDGGSLAAVWSGEQGSAVPEYLVNQAAWDGVDAPLPLIKSLQQARKPYAMVASIQDEFFAARDLIGVKPLYYGTIESKDNPGSKSVMCFASEVKALLPFAENISEFPRGTCYTTSAGVKPFSDIKPTNVMESDPKDVALHLRMLLEHAVCSRIESNEVGSWLSGGLDSSAIVALARPYVDRLYTFAAGLEGASDLLFARQMSKALDTIHIEVIVTLEDILRILPDVIYALESFDALLVRSTATNYLAAKAASDTIGSVFSGEGGDELFAGYSYLENLNYDDIPTELLDITRRLHNTALQRVDRAAGSFGVYAFVPFLDLNVVEYALGIPADMKLHRNEKVIEKWILRLAVEDLLPDQVLWRKKAKFWEGAGIGEQVSEYARHQISDSDYSHERNLSNGWRLNSKEELMYYRIFKEHFGELNNLSWMGRTKGAPEEKVAIERGVL